MTKAEAKDVLSGFVYGVGVAQSLKLQAKYENAFRIQPVMSPEEWIERPVGQAANYGKGILKLCADNNLYSIPFKESLVLESAVDGAVLNSKTPLPNPLCGGARILFLTVDKEERLKVAAALIALGATPLQ